MTQEQAVESTHAAAVDLSPRRRLVILIFMALAITVNALNSIEPFYTIEALKRNPNGGPLYHTAVGAAYSFHQFATIAVTPFVISDLPNIGSKKMLVIALGAEGAVHMLFALLGRIHNWKVFLAYSYCIRAIEGMTFAATQVASLSCVIKLYPNEMGFASGFLLTFLSIGHAAAELVVGGLYDLGGFKTPLLVIGFMMVVVSAAMAIFMVDVDEMSAIAVSNGSAAREKHVSPFAVLRVPWAATTLLMMICLNIAYGALAALLAVRMKDEFGTKASIFGAAFGLQITINAVFATLVGALLDRGWKSRPIIIAGIVMVGFGCLLIGPANFLHLPNSLWLMFLTQVPWGIGRISALVAGICFIYKHCERVGLGTAVELRVAVAGLTRTSMTLGYALGPIICSPLVAVVGFKETYMVLGIFNFGMAGVIALAVVLSKVKETVESVQQANRGVDDDLSGSSELRPLNPSID